MDDFLLDWDWNRTKSGAFGVFNEWLLTWRAIIWFNCFETRKSFRSPSIQNSDLLRQEPPPWIYWQLRDRQRVSCRLATGGRCDRLGLWFGFAPCLPAHCRFEVQPSTSLPVLPPILSPLRPIIRYRILPTTLFPIIFPTPIPEEITSPASLEAAVQSGHRLSLTPVAALTAPQAEAAASPISTIWSTLRSIKQRLLYYPEISASPSKIRRWYRPFNFDLNLECPPPFRMFRKAFSITPELCHPASFIFSISKTAQLRTPLLRELRLCHSPPM